MKISCIDLEKALALSPEEKWELVCGGVVDGGECADVAILLGCPPKEAIERARSAAELYRSGRVKYIVASGGVEWEHEGVKLSEADLMRREMIAQGVPDEAILLDNEAKTTAENMICSTLVIYRTLKLSKTDSVTIVTSAYHVRRSMALAGALLHRKFKLSFYPSFPTESREEWLKSERNVKRLDTEITLLKRLVANRVVDDVEIPNVFD